MTEANMRRLPSWMLKVKTAENPIKSSTKVEKSTKSDNETKIQAIESKSKHLEKKNNDKSQTQERKIKHKEDIMQGCRMRRRKTPTERDNEDAKKNSKRTKFEDEVKINGSNNSKKQRMKKKSKNCDTEVLSVDMSDDEEVSLTVEDLLSIAEEYVSVDRRQCKDQAITDKSSEPSSSTMTSKLGVDGAILSKCTNDSLNSHLAQRKENESKNDKIDNVSSNTISTGDAVQDMLNLYLGPFISNPAPVEPSFRAVESENFSTFQTIERKRMPSVSDFNKQVKSCEIPKEEADARLMKKKSSLRDKVAMFID